MTRSPEPPGGPAASLAFPADPTHSDRELGVLSSELQPDLEVVRLLGQGRSSRVYLARERPLNRLVAVKVLAAELAGDRVALGRFEREARAAAGLAHPNVVAVHRFGYLDSGIPHLVLQYVRGGTLEDRVAAEGVLPVDTAREVLACVADALAAAHRNGFVHRDLRPGNVLCDEECGRVLVADFGLAGILPEAHDSSARLTRAGELLGVPEYTSPEQLRGEEACEPSDVYALGIMAYRLLTGEGPFGAPRGRALLAAHLREPPRPLRSLRPEVDDAMAALLERCLAKDPAGRPRAAFLAAALRAPSDAAAGADASSPPPERDILADALRRRVPQIVAVTAAVGFGTVGFIDQLSDHQVLPEAAYRLALATLVFSMIAAGVVAWFHGRPGRQRFSLLEVALLGLVGVAWLLSCAAILLR